MAPALRRKRKMPASPSKVSGQPSISASDTPDLSARIAGAVRDAAPGWRSVQSVISTGMGKAVAVPATRVTVVGEKVQVELAGRPEQEKLRVPDRVLLGLTKIATSVVEPCATETSGAPALKFSGPGLQPWPSPGVAVPVMSSALTEQPRVTSEKSTG